MELQSQVVIRDPYVFEFLGLKPREVMHESKLEDALLDKVQDFLLELGRGFSFEARQKRILIGGEHFFVDMVFYHRILRCHVRGYVGDPSPFGFGTTLNIGTTIAP